MIQNFFWTKTLEQFGKVRIRSITDSLFSYGVFLILIAVIASIFHADQWVVIVAFSIGGLFLIVGLSFYCYFAIKSPDYLRSESFQIRKQSIEMLGDKTNSLNQNIREIVAIASPYAQNIKTDSNDKLNSGNE